MEMLQEFLIEDALIIVPALLIIGYILKSTPNFKTWLIPYVMLFLGIILALLLLGFTVANFIQGILVAGAAVLSHQIYRQTKKKDV